MKLMALVLALSCVALAKGTPKYSCPEVDVDFLGNEIMCDGGVPGVVSWEDCGKVEYSLKFH